MWQRIDYGYVRNGAGFEVERAHRTWLVYREENREIRVAVDPGPPSLALYPASIKRWEPPFDEEVLTDERRREILSRVKEALRVLGINYEVVW